MEEGQKKDLTDEQIERLIEEKVKERLAKENVVDNETIEGNYRPIRGESKTALGVVFGIFLGLIGLLIGLCLYPANTYERETFLNGWIKTFVIITIISVILVFILFLVGIASLGM